MAFNMKRPVIKGSVLHKASVRNSEERQGVESNADLISAASNLGKSRGVQGIDYSIESKDVKFKKAEKKKDDSTDSFRNKCIGPGCPAEDKEDEKKIIDNWSQGENDPDEIDPGYFDKDGESINTGVVNDKAGYTSMPVIPPPNPNDLRVERSITLAPKNFKLKPIRIDSEDLKIKKASGEIGDYKPTIGKEELEVIKKAEENKRRANDPLLAEINNRRKLKKEEYGPENVDPLTKEILDQSDMPKPDYTPEYRKNVKASKVDSIDPKSIKTDVNFDPKFKKSKRLAHEDGKNYVPTNLPDGIAGNFYNGPNKNTYVPSIDDNGRLQVTWNGRVLAEHEVPDKKLKEYSKIIDDKYKELDANDPLLQQITQKRTIGPSPAQKRDDGIWKRAVKGGKAQQNMRKSGYIPPEER
jgi:hypothetical protein